VPAVQQDAGRVRVSLVRSDSVPLFELKPIEAMQLTKDNVEEVRRFINSTVYGLVDSHCDGLMYLDAHEDGKLVVNEPVCWGDYIFRDSADEVCVMQQDTFERIYQQITSH